MTADHDIIHDSHVLAGALEHGVPEQLFSTPQRRAQGVSAAKALQIAAQQGQRIYHITPSNQAQGLASLRLDSLALSEITQALATGKEVITHTDRISVPGFTGEGYILFDPVSGSGAYKITGGNNGGFVETEDGIGVFIESIGNILAEAGDLIARILGKFISGLDDAFDAINIWDACPGTDAKVGSLYAFIVTTIVFGRFLAIASATMPLLGFILFVLLITVLMNFLVDFLVSDCRRHA